MGENMQFQKTIVAGIMVLILAGCSGQEKPKKAPVAVKQPVQIALKSEAAKFSYAMGLDIGVNLKRMEVALDQAALLDGLKTALAANGKPRMTPAEAATAKQAVFRKKRAEQLAKVKSLGEKNKKEGAAFLAENGKKKGVKRTASGLQYQVIKQGKGPNATPADSVKVQYVGSLIDGTEFDSSVKRGAPATFPLTAVIPGWTEGLQLMNAGSKYKLFIPAKLAYGERGAGSKIGPNATLVFDVELLEIIKNNTAKPAAKQAPAKK